MRHNWPDDIEAEIGPPIGLTDEQLVEVGRRSMEEAIRSAMRSKSWREW
jgi:hypothetical protein